MCGMTGQHCTGSETCCSDGCFDVSNNPTHCGPSCNVCGNGQTCIEGKCTSRSCVVSTDCGTGQQCCSGTCFSLLDENHCGNCSTSCSGGKVAEGCCQISPAAPACSALCPASGSN
jgi:hypothetical protein